MTKSTKPEASLFDLPFDDDRERLPPPLAPGSSLPALVPDPAVIAEWGKAAPPLEPVAPPRPRLVQTPPVVETVAPPAVVPPPVVPNEPPHDAFAAVEDAATRSLPPIATMHQTALVFLDDPLARRLAAAWPMSTGDEDDWLTVAGIRPSSGDALNARSVCRSLMRMGICRAGGITDPLAMTYITQIVLEPLKKAAAKAAPPKGQK